MTAEELRQKMRLAAMNMLARREQSRTELQQKLHDRFIVNAGKRRGRRAGYVTTDTETDTETDTTAVDNSQATDVAQADFSAETVLNDVLDRLQMQGLQDDGRFAESYTRARYNRGDGPQKVRSALRTKGIANDMAQCLLDDPQFDWFESAAQVLRRKFDSATLLQGQRDMKLRARQQRFLAGRGFTLDQIREAMEACVNEDST